MGKYSIGGFEEVVLLTVAILFENAYGVSIKDEMEARLKRKVSVGAMRTALSRLEKKGLHSFPTRRSSDHRKSVV